MKTDELKKYWEGNAEAWTRLSRAGYDVYRDGLNTPRFLSMLPKLEGLSGLDIGCGEGSNTRHLAQRGAVMHGVDIAPTFVHYAEESEKDSPLGIRYRVCDAIDLPFSDENFDFSTAFMSLMDMPDLDAVLSEVYRVLKPKGFLQFSITHPCYVPPYRKVIRDDAGETLGVFLSGYYDPPEGQIDTWLFSMVPTQDKQLYKPFMVPRFHRTLSMWMNALFDHGFILEALCEPQASLEEIEKFPALEDTRIVPQALIIKAAKRLS